LPDIDAGVSRIVRNLLHYKPVDKDIQYAVVLIRRNDQKEIQVTETLDADEVIRFNYREDENPFVVFRRLSKTLKSEHDIIVGNDGLEIKMVVTQHLKNPVLYIVHGDFPDYYNIVNNYYPVINSIVAYSTKIEKSLLKMPGIDKVKVHKIYYPANIKQSFIKSKSENSGRFKIVFAGMLVERKGAELLPLIYDGLVERGMHEFDFKIIGDGELYSFLKTSCERFHQIVLTGWKDHAYVQEAMQQADVFLFPSRLEGLPNVLIEALAAGAVPVVTNLESGVRDIIQHDLNGLLVEADDIAGYCEAILKLYNNREHLERLRLNSKGSLGMFAPYAQAKAYEDLAIETAKKESNKETVFPNYKRGRFLDRKWIPNWLLITIRKIIKNPKL